MILGIDEVGRGPWAGPLVVGAVVLGDAMIEGLTDSKKLSKKRRSELDVIIRAQAAGFGLGWVTANELDDIGLSEALRLATRRAVGQIKTPYHEIIIDGTINFLADTNKGDYVTTMKKADLLVPCVSAASIVAKVARDKFMTEQDAIYPGYGFASHVGYGTAAHIKAINELGVTPLHRLSFGPLVKYRSQNSPVTGGVNQNKSRLVTTIGYIAESVAAEHLQKMGHKIIDRNWKTKTCEIDIVSKYENRFYFTEVKYRRQSNQGGGIAAITKVKLHQMKRAAEFYALSHNINGDLRLIVISMTDNPPRVDNLIEID